MTVNGISIQTPVHRYLATGAWESTSHSLLSPAPDGTVAYYVDSLAYADPPYPAGPVPFDQAVGRALCQWLIANVTRRSMEIADGPYVQILPEDGLVPTNWVMLRAVLWTDEFDLVTPVDAASVADR